MSAQFLHSKKHTPELSVERVGPRNTKRKGSRVRGFAYTVFLQNLHIKNFINNLKILNCKHHVFQTEKSPSTERLHIQGFVYFENAKRWDVVKKMIGGNCHLEPLRKDVNANVLYCNKEKSWDGTVRFKRYNRKVEIDIDNSSGELYPMIGSREWHRLTSIKFDEWLANDKIQNPQDYAALKMY